MGNYNSALTHDTEEFYSIVSVKEKLNEQVTLSMEVEREENQNEEQDSQKTQDDAQVTSPNGAVMPAAEFRGESFSSLLPKALSAVLHARLPQGHNSHPLPGRDTAAHTSPKLEELRTELKELRGQFEQMKSQHNKEIKLLMNELDEEKKIRLSLQMEMQRMKKHWSK